VVLAEVVRSGFVEGRHHGSVVALAADGSVAWQAGDPWQPVFPRSANKPLQATGMVRRGLRTDPQLLALATASHSGEPFHLDGVRRLLGEAGLDEDALQTPPDYPLDEAERLTWAGRGAGPAPVAMNCSGKHAAMLATCVANGWPTAGYRDPLHPLQAGLRAEVELLSGEPVAATGVDGCGAPLWAISLVGLARAFARLARSAPGSAEHEVAAAVRAHPEWLGGSRRDVTQLIRAVPGMIAKDGAEGVYAAALPDGRAVALKIADGAARARVPVLVAALRRLGVAGAALEQVGHVPVVGGGAEVGLVRAVG
jgi:L-asparaginase II